MIILETFDSDELDIVLDVYVSDGDNMIGDTSIEETIDVDKDHESILSDIVDILKEYGFTELSRTKSPSSTSLYVTFCDNGRFDSRTVNLVIRIRVADHFLIKHDDDRTYQDAKNRQKRDLQNYANDFKFDLNKEMETDVDMPVDMLYVKYNNAWYFTLDDLYDKIRDKLNRFIHKNIQRRV